MRHAGHPRAGAMTNAGLNGHLALVLQGGGDAGPYTAPVLLPSLALGQLGARVEFVPYPDSRPRSLEREDAAAFDKFVGERVREIAASGRWSRVTFIAKSRGTMFLSTMTAGLVDCPDVEAIWVTPLLGLAYVREGLVDKGWWSLFVAGGADPHHDAAAHDAVVAALGASSLVIDGANHGLVVDGDVVGTVEGYRSLALASLAFADRSPGASSGRTPS